MKRLFILFVSLCMVFLASCGGEDKERDENTIKVGATSVPHAEVLEEIEPKLEEEGITLEIELYEEYVLPNDDLANGEIDANYFQHIPHLEQTVEDTGYDITHIGGVHIEPMGVYSMSYQSIDEVPEGTEVILSNSVADHARVLELFNSHGLITLDEDVDVDEATFDDITENPKDLQFSPDYEAAMLPELYETEEDTLVVINTNYAIEAGLDPMEDALFIEEEDSPYVNVLAVKEEDKDDEALNTLLDVLHSEETQDFMLENYDGAVIPVDE